MRIRTYQYRSSLKRLKQVSCLVVLMSMVLPALAQRPIPPQPKNIRGVVRDLRGQAIMGANVFIRNLDTNVIRTLTTKDDGLYAVTGLPPIVDYEVFAAFAGKESEKRLVSGFLNRVDNVLNFELDVAIVPAESALDDEPGALVIETFDLVQIHGSFEIPVGIPAPIPGVLLLHGYGETRAVWNDLKERLLIAGWAVMAIDLRGHGQSLVRNRDTIAAEEGWRTEPRQFPLDVGPALDWMKSQPRLDSTRLAVIGADVGANLALIASGRFSEVGTVVAINPNLDEALAMAATARDFNPRTTHLIVSDRETGESIREYVNGASRITVTSAGGGTPVWLATSDTIDEILRWLRDTY